MTQHWTTVVKILAAPALVASSAMAQMPPPTFANVAYGPHPLQVMDVYLAPSTSPLTGPTPVLLEFHPGGWAGGDKSQLFVYSGFIETVLSKGISVVSVNYPLAPEVKFPVPNQSCQRAIQFVRSKSSTWNLHAGRVGLCGLSAGGHLAAWAAMAPDAALPLSTDPVLRQSSRVKALIMLASPSDLTSASYVFDPNVGHGISPVWPYFGADSQASFDTVPDSVKQAASPQWMAVHGGAALANAQVAFLGLYAGDPLVKTSSVLTVPNGDVHSQVHGMLMYEALRSIGSLDCSIHVSSPGWTGLEIAPRAEMAAEWLAGRLAATGICNRGQGVAGCASSQMPVPNGAPLLGNPYFRITTYENVPNYPASILISDVAGTPEGTDYFSIGTPMLINPFTPNLILASVAAYGDGSAILSLPIPNDPALLGVVVYAQTISVWPDGSTFGGCSRPPFQLGISNLLELTIQ